MIFTGIGNIPFAPGRASDLVVVNGKPIMVPTAVENPSSEEIAKFHKLYVEETTRVFNTYKEAFGMGHVTLRIV